MTPNLASARQAIQAELSHAREGVAFYSARVEALETALSQLESVDGDEAAIPTKGKRKTAAGNRQKAGELKRGRKPRMAQGGAANRVSSSNGTSGADRREGKRGRKARTVTGAREAATLPTTGSEFWLNLVSDEPRSAVDIANAAASALGLQPEQKTQIQKLKQRVAPALASLVSSHKIQDTGAGRERRFFKGERPSA